MNELGRIDLAGKIVVLSKLGVTNLYKIHIECTELTNGILPLVIRELTFEPILNYVSQYVEGFDKNMEMKLLMMYQQVYKKYSTMSLDTIKKTTNSPITLHETRLNKEIVFAEVEVYLREKKPFMLSDLELLEGKLQVIGEEGTSGSVYVNTEDSSKLTLSFADYPITEYSIKLFQRVVAKLQDSYVNILLEAYGDDKCRLYELFVTKLLDTV